MNKKQLLDTIDYAIDQHVQAIDIFSRKDQSVVKRKLAFLRKAKIIITNDTYGDRGSDTR